MDTLSKPRTGSRRKVLKDETLTNSAPASNSMDAESFLVWVGKLRQEDAVFDLARKRRAKARRLAKIAGMDMSILDRVLKDADKDPDIVLKGMATYKQYSDWLDAPGKQFSLFDLPNSAMLSHKEREEKARRTGYTRGVMGQNPDAEAYPIDNEHHQQHMEGWHDGQRVHLDRIQPINIALDSDGKGDDADDDAMDEAA